MKTFRLLPTIFLVFFSVGRETKAADESFDGQWRYTTRRPADGWQSPGFDDGRWRKGFGGFGVPSTPGSRVATFWRRRNIWLRRRVNLDEIPAKPALLIHHDEDATVYLNGKQAARFEGYVVEYKVVPLDDQAKTLLKKGQNLLAVHCRQTGGGQFIDVHLVDADNVPKLPEPKRPMTPFKSDLITRWGEQVTPDNAWRKYPRPMLVRKDWRNLNGHWDYAVTAKAEGRPDEWKGKILVPFCLESKLSGVQRLLDPSEALWYHRTFELDGAPKQRLLLNFEAVDYRCEVWVNDVSVGRHVGGNTPFAFDVTRAAKQGVNHLVLRVEDETGGAQLRGKQTLEPHGIWYTRVSGIWQTVWMEHVPNRYVDRLKITTDVDTGEATVEATLAGEPVAGEQLRITALEGDRQVARETGAGASATVKIPNPTLWSPGNPHLYALKVELLNSEGEVLDQADSYTALRKVGRTRDADGHWRFTLNGKPIFHLGPLDQGWWPDGLLTPPADEAMLFELRYLKESGFNMVRKHIKVEPRRYYFLCDWLGMMVWQDQVSGGQNPRWTRMRPNPNDAQWSDGDHQQYLYELAEMIDHLGNHPSIVVWVPFNEAWGQHRTTEVGRWVMKYDPTRLVNVASGGNFWPVGHVADHHSYPHPDFPFQQRFGDYIKVVGEYGGHGWPVKGHLWDAERDNWGYGGLPQSIEEYKERYRKSAELLVDLKAKGIAGGVYTQTTDVEGEINGLMTYDRKVIKISPAELKKIHQPLVED